MLLRNYFENLNDAGGFLGKYRLSVDNNVGVAGGGGHKGTKK